MSLLVPLSGLLFLVASHLTQGAGREFVSESHGFAIDVPRGWALKETESNALGRYQLRVYPIETEGLVAVTVEIERPTGVTSTAAAIEAALARVEGQPGYDRFERLEGRVAGRDALGLSVRFEDPSLGSFHIRQHYLLEGGALFVLQAHAPIDEFDKWSERLDGALATLRFLESKTTPEEVLLARCGSEVEWVRGWEAAARRARKEDKPVLVAIRFQPGFQIADTVRQVTFLDPDLIELVNERCVLMRLEKGMPAPFVDQASYGVGPMAFGTALFYCSADGEVLHESSSLDPQIAYPLLTEWLAQHEEHGGAGVPRKASKIERAERFLRRGELERALEASAGDDSARAHLLRARAHRRMRSGEPASAALELAQSADGAEALADELALEAMVLALRMGDDARAQALVGEERAAVPAARYLSGVCQARRGDFEGARETWRELMAASPESRWAWCAAAALASPMIELELPPVTEFVTDDMLQEQRVRPAERLGKSRLREVERRALAWLLAEQRADGSWLSARSSARSVYKVSNPFTDAVSAIAGMACLAHRKDPAAAEAAQRALAFALELRTRRAADETPIVFMDYTAYADAWTIRFLAECIEAGWGDADSLRIEIEALVAELAVKQRANGGWSYYLSGEAREGAPRVEQSISFVTALATLALLHAEEVGARVPSKVRAGALDCLEAMRSDGGTFTYMLHVGAKAAVASAPDSAGRAPVCELALLRGGRSDPERLAAALAMFDAHVDGLAKEVGKALMHCGPAGQGCHYVFFDYQTAAEAAAELPARKTARTRALLVERILDARSVDGSFRDSPINGWAYGTAMALLALGAG